MKRLTDEELIEELRKRFTENKKSLQEQKKLAKELKTVNKKLEESESLKSHFISHITNEIINPFASILGLSRNILAVKEQDWDKVKSMVELIHSEAFNLDFQLKNIFIAAKLEAGEAVLEILNIDIPLLITNIIESFSHEAHKKNIQINYLFDPMPGIEKSFYFKTDPEKLRLIIVNLINNALKYSPENSSIEVKGWMKNNKLHISVKDFAARVKGKKQNIAILFGREGKGLFNSEIKECDFVVTIPASKKYPVLNLSQSCVVFFYELFNAVAVEKTTSHVVEASAADKKQLFKMLNSVLSKMEFSTKEKKETQRIVWKRIIGKSFMTKREAFALMGFLRKFR